MIMFLLYITEMMKYIDAFIIYNRNHWRSIPSQIYKFSVKRVIKENLWFYLGHFILGHFYNPNSSDEGLFEGFGRNFFAGEQASELLQNLVS